MSDTNTVVEHIQTIISNVHQNRVNMANQLEQGRQQISVLEHQYEAAGTLLASLESALELGIEHMEAILKRVLGNKAAASQVAGSPPQPAAGAADASVAGASQG